MAASKFSKNLRTRNMEEVLVVLEKLSRPGIYADWTIKIVDGEIGDHQEINLKIRPNADDLRKTTSRRTLDELAEISAE